MPHTLRPGDLLAERYRLIDLLSESGGGRFWRALDQVLERHVAVHVIAAGDPRAPDLMAAARRSATVMDQRILRVLDVDTCEGHCYVVNEWGSGTSLDIMLAAGGVLSSRAAAWVVAETSTAMATAHAAGVVHGRLNPENVLVDRAGAVRVIGLCVDAALHGTGAARADDDVTDLAGLLYAALTGRWAGVSTSVVPPAPQEHGRVLRPRQVRAGVPRPLDSLCDEVLNPYARDARGLGSARGISESLVEFVGDPAGLADALVGRLVARGSEAVVLSAVPEFGFRDPDSTDTTGTTDTTDTTGETAGALTPAQPLTPAGPESVEQPTQAGLPIFDDELDDVSWLEAPAGPSAPPPPFEEPPARPLFAPEPSGGEPVRRPRPGAAASTESQSFWPWGHDTGSSLDSGPPTALGSGFGSERGAVITTPAPPSDEVPGRNAFRVAAALLAAMLLLVAVVVAFNLGRGKTPLGADPEPDTSPSTSRSPGGGADPAANPISGLVVTDLDPQGDPPIENPELAPLAVDGDPATGWRTSTYVQDLGPGGLKSGLGLVVDLGSSQSVGEVDLQLIGEPTGIELFVTDTLPTKVVGLEPVAEVSASASEEIPLETPATGRYVVVWLTSLPAVDGGFRGEISEIVVRGG
ncbi:MAG: protein kinase [Actinobacteria bacterium]|uniref:Unannotated protein n=1 Tax=freshwater metagenome TaxID=449393 RepID=A0A6J6P6Z7_9ZZZZ|nr:protein kinase [Actinomycetota bacterium]